MTGLVGSTTAATCAPRSDFGALADWTYLNQAAIGLRPAPVTAAMHEFETSVSVNGTISFDDEAESRAVEKPRQAAAALLGVNPEHVAVTTNATEVVNQFAWLLRPGRSANVVSIDVEFPSVTYPWLRLSQETGAEVRLLAAEADPAGISVERLARLVDDKTEVICVSHVQYATGHRLNPAALRELADSAGAVLLLDVTQSAGVIPMEDCAVADVVFASAYKWLCGPCGAAFCYVSPAMEELLPAPFVGWRSTKSPVDFDARRIDYALSARVLETGTPSYTSAVGMAAGIEYLMGLGIENVARHVSQTTGYLIDQLELLGGELITPRSFASRAGVVSARFPTADAQSLAQRLYADKVVVGARLGAVRFAVHAYNSAADVDTAMHSLEAALAGASE